jgi:hypothetical protein
MSYGRRRFSIRLISPCLAPNKSSWRAVVSAVFVKRLITPLTRFARRIDPPRPAYQYLFCRCLRAADLACPINAGEIRRIDNSAVDHHQQPVAELCVESAGAADPDTAIDFRDASVALFAVLRAGHFCPFRHRGPDDFGLETASTYDRREAVSRCRLGRRGPFGSEFPKLLGISGLPGGRHLPVRT